MKKYLNFSRKSIEFALIFGLLCSITLSMSHFNAACDDLRSNVLRMHIIANSNSDEDQCIKYKIRDEILKESPDVFAKTKNLDEAIITAKTSLTKFQQIADKVIQEQGKNYSAEVKIGKSYFENREYDDFTLPAGTYESLIINLGNSKGHNWWCVVFPTVCISAAAKGQLSDTTTEESAKIAENPQKYVMKFKSVEIYEDIKNYLNKEK